MDNNLASVESQAIEELEQEMFRKAVEEKKRQLRARAAMPWYRRLFPYTITIRRIV